MNGCAVTAMIGKVEQEGTEATEMGSGSAASCVGDGTRSRKHAIPWDPFMRLYHLALAAACFALGCGCRTHTVSGSLNAFILSKVVGYGGAAPSGGSSNVMVGKWTVSVDNFGTLIQTDKINFEQVDRFLKELYGAPAAAGRTTEGHRQWVIPARTAGVAIWYLATGEGVRIIINKQLRLN